MGKLLEGLVPQGGVGHRALPWEKTAAGGGSAAPAEAAGTRGETRFLVHPQQVPTGCGPGLAPSGMSPGAGLVPRSTRCASCLPKCWPPPGLTRGPGTALRCASTVAQCWRGELSRRVSGTASLVSGARDEAKRPQTNQPRPVTEKEAGGVSGLCCPASPRGQQYPWEGGFGRRAAAPAATGPDGFGHPSPGTALLSRGPRALQPLSIPISSFICCLLLN